jgi:16S rRNA (uracil1498-N3)-methyltransferase
MRLLYQTDLTVDELFLNEEESKHCIRVLRMKKGDEVHLADGKGIHAIANIKDDHPKKCLLKLQSRTQHALSRNYYLHIIVAPTKNIDRMEWFIEKATEAGIDEISFIETENSERAKVNMDRCEKITISAMKQSKQWFLPKINPLQKLSSALQNHQSGNAYIAWCETAATSLLSQKLLTTTSAIQRITILIGPEGDFTPTEVTQATQAGFQPVSLGNSILRTETAAIFACMSVKAIRSS